MSQTIVVHCAVAGCQSTDRVPARKRYINSADDQIVPVQSHPYVCLSCWRQGWRAELQGDAILGIALKGAQGMERSWSDGWSADDPSCRRCGWHVYQLHGHPQRIEACDERVRPGSRT